jgi:hypothetical protein
MNEKEIIDDICKTCLNKEPNKTCSTYVERMVGDCQGKWIKEIEAIDGKRYKVSSGIYFYPKTSNQLIQLLVHLHTINERLRFYWGDPETGLDWGEAFDVTGRIGTTTGRIKMFILVYNRRSYGGQMIMSDHIVRIDWANKKGKDRKIVYCSKYYHTKDDEKNLFGDNKLDNDTLRKSIIAWKQLEKLAKIEHADEKTFEEMNTEIFEEVKI